MRWRLLVLWAQSLIYHSAIHRYCCCELSHPPCYNNFFLATCTRKYYMSQEVGSDSMRPDKNTCLLEHPCTVWKLSAASLLKSRKARSWAQLFFDWLKNSWVLDQICENSDVVQTHFTLSFPNIFFKSLYVQVLFVEVSSDRKLSIFQQNSDVTS